MSEVVTLGEALFGLLADDEAPLPSVRAFRRFVVGAEANLAVGLVRLGRSVSFIGRVGDDGLGGAVRRHLRAEGVDIGGLATDPAAPTGLLIRERRVLVPSTVLYYRRGSAGSRLSPGDLEDQAEAFEGIRWLHVTGITCAISTTAHSAVKYAIERARASGAAISLDINHRRRLWTDMDAAETLRPIAAEADLVFGDATELSVVAGTPADATGREAAEYLLGAGTGRVVVKLGAEGAATYGSNGATAVAALPLPRLIDPIGAGDAFCAGYLAARLEDADDYIALRWGNACGAAVAAAEGDMTGLPTRPELDQILTAASYDTIR